MSVRNGSHNTAALLCPYKDFFCKYSIRNMRHEGEMRDQIPDADSYLQGSFERKTKKPAAYLRVRVM